MFCCYKPISGFNCLSCEYVTYEKSKLLRHICGDPDEEEAIYKKCLWCHKGSYTYVWHYYHQKTCGLLPNITVTQVSNPPLNAIIRLEQVDVAPVAAVTPNICESRKDLIPIVNLIRLNIKEKHLSIEDEELLKCNRCQFKTKRKVSMMRHKARNHYPKKRFKYSKCSFESTNDAKLRAHQHYTRSDFTFFLNNLYTFKTRNKSYVRPSINTSFKECINFEYTFYCIKKLQPQL